MNDTTVPGFSEPSAPQPAATRQLYDPVPAGVWEVEINKAERKAVRWRASGDNPTGECVVLRLTASSAYSFVFVDVPIDRRHIIDHISRAVDAAVDVENPQALVGLRANVEIANYTGRDGRQKSTVAKWLPQKRGPQAAAEIPHEPKPTSASDQRRQLASAIPKPGKPRRCRTVQPYETDDDIPF